MLSVYVSQTVTSALRTESSIRLVIIFFRKNCKNVEHVEMRRQLYRYY